MVLVSFRTSSLKSLVARTGDHWLSVNVWCASWTRRLVRSASELWGWRDDLGGVISVGLNEVRSRVNEITPTTTALIRNIRSSKLISKIPHRVFDFEKEGHHGSNGSGLERVDCFDLWTAHKNKTVGGCRLLFFGGTKVWLNLLSGALYLEPINRLAVEHSWGTRCPLNSCLQLALIVPKPANTCLLRR